MRFAAEDIELHGHTIRRGDAVSLVLAAAHRDEASVRLPAPTGDRTRRQPPPGLWPRRSLLPGRAPCARMEARVALAALLQRLPAPQLGRIPRRTALAHQPHSARSAPAAHPLGINAHVPSTASLRFNAAAALCYTDHLWITLVSTPAPRRNLITTISCTAMVQSAPVAIVVADDDRQHRPRQQQADRHVWLRQRRADRQIDRNADARTLSWRPRCLPRRVCRQPPPAPDGLRAGPGRPPARRQRVSDRGRPQPLPQRRTLVGHGHGGRHHTPQTERGISRTPRAGAHARDRTASPGVRHLARYSGDPQFGSPARRNSAAHRRPGQPAAPGRRQRHLPDAGWRHGHRHPGKLRAQRRAVGQSRST